LEHHAFHLKPHGTIDVTPGHCSLRDQNISQPSLVSAPLSAHRFAELRVTELPCLPEQDAETMWIVTHRRVNHRAGLEVDMPFARPRGRMNAKNSTLPGEIEKLKDIVDPDVLEWAFDCHQGFSRRASWLYFRATACSGSNLRTRANARAASRVRLRSSSDSPSTTNAAR